MNELVLGLLTGLVFGALLQQGRVMRFEKQVGAMLLQDMTIFKFMISAIIVGSIGINLLVSLDIVSFGIKATNLGANIIGGLIFGAGWAIIGFCPGTSVGAVGEGRWHAIFPILGMLVGAAIYAEAYPALKGSVLAWGKLGKITLPGVLGISPWVVIPILTVGYVLLLRWFEKKNL
jgi:uncharacterized protein